MAAVAVAAEEAGADTVMVMDHFYQLPLLGRRSTRCSRPTRSSARWPPAPRRCKLGTLVTGVTYRNPAILAKIVTTLDVISRAGRSSASAPPGSTSSTTGLGVDFPPVKERFERLEEALQICRAMFRGERPTFEGKHYRVKDAINSPAPITPGGPPIMIGGQGEKKTLRLMAQHAEMANFTSGFDELPRKLEVLAGHCADVGPRPGTINKTPLCSVVLGRHHGGGRGACATTSSLARGPRLGHPRRRPPGPWSAPGSSSATPTRSASRSSELIGLGPRRHHRQPARQRPRPRGRRPRTVARSLRAGRRADRLWTWPGSAPLSSLNPCFRALAGPGAADRTDVRAGPNPREPHGTTESRSAGPPVRSVRVNRVRPRSSAERDAVVMATKAIVGEKVGMTQVWDDDNRVVPVTVLRVKPCRVVQVKTDEHDGYTALQVTFGTKKASQAHQAQAGPVREGRRRPRARGSSSSASTTCPTTRWARSSRPTCWPTATRSTSPPSARARASPAR